MKFLVTGQNGFVGGHVTNHVGPAKVVAFPDSVDLVNFEQTRSFVHAQTFDGVLHLAARSSVADSFENPSLTKDVNVEGTRNLLRSLVELKFTGPVLLVSSGEVYGSVEASELPVKETARLAPKNPYAESKVAMESLISSAGEFANAPFSSVIARPFNHIGPGQAVHFVVASFAGQLARRKTGREAGPMKTGDLTVTRDFTDVRDIVAAYALLLEKAGREKSRGEVYNLGSGTETKLQIALESLIEISGTGTTFQIDRSRLRPNEQKRMCADVGKIRATIDWKPRHTLQETLKDCFKSALAKELLLERIGK